MLTQTFQHLEKHGFIRTTSYSVTPLHVEYDLTLLGEKVAKHIEVLADWLEVNFSNIKVSSLNSDNRYKKKLQHLFPLDCSI